LRARARRDGEGELALARHRGAMVPFLAEQAAFALALLSGLLLMQLHGWGVTHARWLGAKLGLVAFLLLPLEAMHAWVAWSWIAPGLGESRAFGFSKALVRGLGVEEMIRTLELVLAAPAVLLLVWLSMAKPF
jgi:hypothetical protein